MPDESIYEVHWLGLFKPSKIRKLKPKKLQKHCLYSIYGSHPLYGDNVLLYVGMTERGVDKRLSEHDYHMDQERFGNSRVFLASIGPFNSWKESGEIAIFEKPERELIQKIESLLRYAHQPCFNTSNRKSAKNSSGIRIFNTGCYGDMHPEASALFEAVEPKKFIASEN